MATVIRLNHLADVLGVSVETLAKELELTHQVSFNRMVRSIYATHKLAGLYNNLGDKIIKAIELTKAEENHVWLHVRLRQIVIEELVDLHQMYHDHNDNISNMNVYLSGNDVYLQLFSAEEVLEADRLFYMNLARKVTSSEPSLFQEQPLLPVDVVQVSLEYIPLKRLLVALGAASFMSLPRDLKVDGLTPDDYLISMYELAQCYEGGRIPFHMTKYLELALSDHKLIRLGEIAKALNLQIVNIISELGLDPGCHYYTGVPLDKTLLSLQIEMDTALTFINEQREFLETLAV